MIRVLFVCLGNICRSPMAEAVFRNEIIKRNLTSKIKVASAATSSWENGKPPHEGTQEVLKGNGITFDGIYSTTLIKEDFKRFDYIIGMAKQNVQDILKLAETEDNKNKVYLFLSVVPNHELDDVPDPYYTGDFEETFSLVNQGVYNWIDKIKKDNLHLK